MQEHFGIQVNTISVFTPLKMRTCVQREVKFVRSRNKQKRKTGNRSFSVVNPAADYLKFFIQLYNLGFCLCYP